MTNIENNCEITIFNPIDMTFTKCGWIYQFNAIPDNELAKKTMYWMKKTYEYFHGELDD